jgi:tRNA pseudouridine55 synthase
MNVVINLDKPAHITSQQAVVKVKRLLGAKKAGHAGTLDPIATGVLIVCLNEATKITRFLSDLDKEYLVQLKLGERTDTFDSTGKIVETKNPGFIREEDLQETLGRFTGCIQQIPPMYSAVKINGTPLYKLARKGISVERRERSVCIHQVQLLSYHSPYVNARVICSKGTYIRTLCDDIGNALGTGAHMTSLTRSKVGNFRLEDAVSFTELSDKKDSFWAMDEALSHLGEILLDHDSWQKAKNGVPVDLCRNNPEAFLKGSGNEICGTSVMASRYVRMKSPDHTLFGIGLLENSSLRVERLFNSPDS